jgi:predicted metal-binding membrane protein
MSPAARERTQVRAPLLLVGAIAWALLVMHPGGLKLQCHGVRHTSLDGLLTHNPPGELAAGWALMLVAMMVPLMTAPIHHVRLRSFAHRRMRATALFLLGYGGLWMLAGFVLTMLALLVPSWVENPLVAASAATAVVVAWQASPFKQACLNQLHAHRELAAFGLAADLDVLRFGLEHGFWCVGSCWGLMFLPMLFPDAHLVGMAFVTLWMWAEQLNTPASPAWAMRFPAKAARALIAQMRLRVQARPSTEGLA